MEPIAKIFENNILFKSLTKKEAETLAGLLTPKSIPEGNVVFLENMPGESLYIIKKGAIKISRMLAGGCEKTVVVQHHYERQLVENGMDKIFDRFELTSNLGKRTIITYNNEFSRDR